MPNESDSGGADVEEPQRAPQQHQHQPLPRWLSVAIVAAFAVATLVHIAVDIAVDTYDGGTTSLMLGGIVGAALAGDRFNANRGGAGGG